MDAKELKELQAIKSLLIVLLIKLGGTPEEVALALGVHPSRISQIMPVRKIKRLKSVS